MSEPSSFNHSKNEKVEHEKDEDKVEEYNDNKNVNMIGEGTSRQNIWDKGKKAQVNECQEKLFGKEKPINEYNLNNNSQQIIVKYYKNKNKKFKEAAERYAKLSPHEKKGNSIEVFL